MSSNFYETDLRTIKPLIGRTSDDIQQRCHYLCANYLNGIWSVTKPEDIVIERISGGMSNQLYHCTLPGHKVINDEPNEVVVRLYKENIASDRHNDTVIGLLMSEYGLGPKIHGSFPEGVIQQYIQHRQFGIQEQNDEKLVLELARKLAVLHSMKVPLNRRQNWLLNTIDKKMQIAYQMSPPIDKLIDELKLDLLTTDRLNEELLWIRQLTIVTDCPVCFTHNDFKSDNIMVIGNECDVNSNLISNRLLFCDFEYSGYGLRGYDFGTLFAEWNRCLPNDYKNLQKFPDDNQLKPFVDEYYRESVRLAGSGFATDSRNSYQNIVNEIKVFTLVSNIFMTIATLAFDVHNCPEMPFLTKSVLMISANQH
ncbi:choline/ethanolamine kinase-like, partial [Oppia nitens]|uniref:choline/ethanolamine kinase-like n=1 Tax=Oppia nitens TaxID=1686743 RepID=UPI0023DB9E34